MRLRWFTRKGILFFPVSIAGWLVLVAGLALAVYEFRSIDSSSHSASDTLINFVFYLLIIGAVYSLIGYFTSSGEKK